MPDTKIVHEARSDNEVLAGDSWECETKRSLTPMDVATKVSAVPRLTWWFCFYDDRSTAGESGALLQWTIPAARVSGRPAKCGYQRGFWMHFWLLTSVNSGLKWRATLY